MAKKATIADSMKQRVDSEKSKKILAIGCQWWSWCFWTL